jgi:hypothetical protein
MAWPTNPIHIQSIGSDRVPSLFFRETVATTKSSYLVTRLRLRGEMEEGRTKAAVLPTLLMMILLLLASSARCVGAAAARLQAGAGGGGHGHHRGLVAESVPAVAPEGKGAGHSNCTHNSNQPKIGPCPPE